MLNLQKQDHAEADSYPTLLDVASSGQRNHPADFSERTRALCMLGSPPEIVRIYFAAQLTAPLFPPATPPHAVGREFLIYADSGIDKGFNRAAQDCRPPHD